MSSASALRKTARPKGTHYEVAKRLGLIGCIDGPPDLAKNRRKYMRQALCARNR